METIRKIGIFKGKTYELPKDSSSHNLQTFQIIRVCRALSHGLPTINNGGCGMFAIMLDSIFNGSIAKLELLGKVNKYDGTFQGENFHEIFIKGNFCYDAYDVCTITTLFREKGIKRIMTSEEMYYRAKPNRFFLIKRTPDIVLRDYFNDTYNPDFANRRKMNQLFGNYKYVISSLPVNLKAQCRYENVSKIINCSNDLILSLAA